MLMFNSQTGLTTFHKDKRLAFSGWLTLTSVHAHVLSCYFPAEKRTSPKTKACIYQTATSEILE